MEVKDTSERQEQGTSAYSSMEDLTQIDVESDRVGTTAQKLVNDMWEYTNSPNTTHKDLAAFGDNAARQGAGDKLKGYFDVFSNKLESKLDLGRSDLDDFHRLLKVCIRFSDASDAFSEAIASSGILSNLMDLLRMFKASFDDYIKEMGQIVFHITAILYNCSRSSNNTMFYKDLNAVELIGWYSIRTKGLKINGENSLSTCCMLILAYITDDEEKDVILTDGAIIDNILENLDRALSSPQLRSKLGFWAKELACGLKKLANNDENSRIIYRRQTMTRLEQLIEKGGLEDKIAAVKCIWALSFENRKRIIENEESVVEKLKKLLETGESKLQRAAASALWVLQNDETKAHPQNQRVMLSYSWANKEKVLQIKDALKRNGYRVWIDVDEVHGDIYKRMAEGVEKAAVVLVCMSQAYNDSQFCRMETEYAATLNKPIIPLKMQKGFNPSSWLGIIAAGKLYYKFAGEEDFDQVISKLMSEIGDRGKE